MIYENVNKLASQYGACFQVAVSKKYTNEGFYLCCNPTRSMRTESVSWQLGLQDENKRSLSKTGVAAFAGVVRVLRSVVGRDHPGDFSSSPRPTTQRRVRVERWQ